MFSQGNLSPYRQIAYQAATKQLEKNGWITLHTFMTGSACWEGTPIQVLGEEVVEGYD